MTATAAQISANRANALQSTGPRTPEGKAASAGNARTHGYTAARFAVRPEEADEFSEYANALAEEILPCGALEQHHCTILIQAGWNLHRLRDHEFELLGSTGNPFLDDETSKALDRLARYRRAIERTYKDALAALRTLQTNRAAHEGHGPSAGAGTESLPPLAELVRLSKRSQSGPSQDPLERELTAIETETRAFAVAARLRALVEARNSGEPAA